MGSKYRELWVIRALRGISVLVCGALFCLCWELCYKNEYSVRIGMCGETAVYAIYTIFLYMLQRIYGAHDVGSVQGPELAYSAVLADFMLDSMVYIMIAAAWRRMPAVLPIVGVFLLQSGWHCLWAFAGSRLYCRLFKPKRTVIIYRNARDLEKIRGIGMLANRFDVQKYIEAPQNIGQIIREVQGFEVIFVLGVNAELRNGIAKYCAEADVQGYIEPKTGDVLMRGAESMCMFGILMMRLRSAAPAPEYLFLKRAFDIAASIAGIVVLSPLMIAIAAAIRLYDGGPVLYKQTRLTKDGKYFGMLKFRSMCVDAEKDGVARLSTGEDDSRVTPVGRILRAYRLDELPQLFNILAGSMTIVGPRPERPEIAAQYEKQLPAFALRLQVKAGLTGYAQVHGRYNTHPYDKLQMDLMYIGNMSIAEDLRLMLATVKVLFKKESTEGVRFGQTTAMDEEKNDTRNWL